MKTLIFDDRTALLNVFYIHGSEIPKSFQNRPKSLRGASWAPGWPQVRAKSGMGSPWETKNAIWKDVWSHLGHQGEGEESGWTSAQAPPGYGRAAGVG